MEFTLGCSKGLGDGHRNTVCSTQVRVGQDGGSGAKTTQVRESAVTWELAVSKGRGLGAAPGDRSEAGVATDADQQPATHPEALLPPVASAIARTILFNSLSCCQDHIMPRVGCGADACPMNL